MRIGIIGAGAIGGYVAGHLARQGSGPAVILARSPVPGPGALTDVPRVTEVAQIEGALDLMVDCAGHAALAAHGPALLERGISVITVSLGALADAALEARLERAAGQGGARLHLASGAIGALDALMAARVGGLREVTYTGRKPPEGWRGSPAETALDLGALTAQAVHFEGSARQAALRYPKNANVAAAVALAGAGFDHTRVRLIADPAAAANIHEVEARGAFGRFSFRIEGATLPDNPRSSALAAMSVVAAIARQCAPVTL